MSCRILHAMPLFLWIAACGFQSTESAATPTISTPRSPAPAITPTASSTPTPSPTQTPEPGLSATPALAPQSGNAYSPSFYADGRYLSFRSFNNYQSQHFVYDLLSGEYLSLDTDWEDSPRFTPDGRYVVYSNQGQIYVYDQSIGESELVSLSSSGAIARRESCCPSISDDGRYVAFSSLAGNLAKGGCPERLGCLRTRPPG